MNTHTVCPTIPLIRRCKFAVIKGTLKHSHLRFINFWMCPLPSIRCQMRIQLLLLEETLLTELAGVWKHPQMRLHVVMHCILLILCYSTLWTDIESGLIPNISHTRWLGYCH